MGAIGMLQTLRVIYSSAATDSARYRRNSLYPPNEMFPFFLFSSSLCRPLPFVCVLAGHTHTKSNEVDVLAICFYLFIFFLSNKGPTLERKTKWIDILKGIQMKSKRISFCFYRGACTWCCGIYINARVAIIFNLIGSQFEIKKMMGQQGPGGNGPTTSRETKIILSEKKIKIN